MASVLRREARSASPKFTQPRLHAVLARPRLIDRLAGTSAPLRWICAGPGYGKTTLAVSWIEACFERSLWYQVDAGDDDPAAFFADLGTAASAAGLHRAASLPPWPGDGASRGAHARRFFRHLFVAWPSDMALVFDNVHRAVPETWGELLRTAVEELPDDVPVLAISHELPPPVLARQVAHGRIEVFDAVELRFTDAECDELLRARQVGRDLRSALLLQRCEGWAAGLALMIDSLRHGGPTDSSALEGARHAAFDYFVGEVLARCTPGEQRELMRAAWLPHVSAALVAAMGSGSDVLGLLERLHRQHLFVERVAVGETTYRLHGLFQSFLKERATSLLSADERAANAMSAARVLLAEGAGDEAVQLLVDTQCWPEAAECIAHLAPGTIDAARRRTVADWAAALPPEWLDRLPWLAYWAGAGRVFDDPAAGERLLLAAHRRFVETGDRDGRVLAAGALTRALLLQADWSRLDPWIDELDAQWSADTEALSHSARLVGGARLLYATLARMPGRAGQAAWSAQVQAQLESLDPGDEGLLAGFALLMHHNWTGQTSAARDLVRQLEPWTSSGATGVVARSYWAWACALHRWWCDEPERALAAIDQALDLAAGHGLAIASVIRRYRVMALLTADRLGEAEGELQRLATAPRVEPYFELRAWAALQRGELDTAHEEAQSAMALAESRGRTCYRLQDHLLLAIIEARAGRTAQARTHLQCYCDGTRGVPGDLPAYQSAWIEAHLALQSGDHQACRAALERAGTLGEHHHFRTIFGWDPAFMRPLLELAMTSGAGVEHARTLIVAHRFSAPAVDTENWPWPLQVRMFGAFTLVVAGRDQPWGVKAPKKPLELLQALVALETRSGQGVSTATLIDQLWPDADGDAAHNAFNVALSRLRRLLGDPLAVVQHDNRVRLDVHRVWSDVAVLQRLAERADTVHDADAAQQLVHRLLDVYRGPFLADLDAPWAAACRERQRLRFRRSVARLIDTVASAGQIVVAERLRGLCAEVDAQAVAPDARGSGRALRLVRD